VSLAQPKSDVHDLGLALHAKRELPLILVNSESDLGLSRLRDDVACAARDHAPTAFVNDRDQRHVIDKVDVQE
jgi:hypothetical protein